MRKFALAAAAATALGFAVFASAPAQAAGVHLSVALSSPVIESDLTDVRCYHRRWRSRWVCWHSRWRSRRW
jgi:hypothetical protein